ncbi:MAG: hypothetical protein ACOY9J_01140 [Pseudomonadota bacterium]
MTGCTRPPAGNRRRRDGCQCPGRGATGDRQYRARPPAQPWRAAGGGHRSFRDPQFTARALHVSAALRDAACAALRSFRGSRTPEQFDEAVAFALRMVLATLDQQLFVPPGAPEQLASDDATLGAKLADAFIRYLQLAPSAPS